MAQRRRRGAPRAQRSSQYRHAKSYSYKVVCSGCGKEVVLPVHPPEGKALLCMECFVRSGKPKET